MKRILLIAAGIVFAAGAAYAADPMANMYGNTLVQTHADGSTAKFWMKADHTYTGVDGKGTKISGTWAVEKDQVCGTQLTPPPAAGKEKNCGPMHSDKKPGDSWEEMQGTEKVKVSLVAGP